MEKWLGTLLSLVAGAAIWFLMRALTGEGDPESHGDYWRIGYPAMVAVSLVIGFRFNRRPWRWGIYIVAVQLVIGAVLVRGDLNLLPIGLLFHVVDAVPCVVAAYIGSWLSRWRPKGK